jgi:CHASE2 domain-containing sensor protein
VASLRSHSSPYTSLFLEKDFDKYRVNESELFSPTLSTELDDRVRGRVAVIGFEGERAVATNIGPVPGHVLHAAYLEAFLDGRALSEVSAWSYWPLAVVFWAFVEFIQQRRGDWFALGTIACGFGVLLVLTLLLVNFPGFYSDFPTISLAGLFVWISNFISRLGFRH